MNPKKELLIIVVGEGQEQWTHNQLSDHLSDVVVITSEKSGTTDSIKKVAAYINQMNYQNTFARVILNGGCATRLEPLSNGNKGSVLLPSGKSMLQLAIETSLRFPATWLKGMNTLQLSAVDIVIQNERVPKPALLSHLLKRTGCVLATVPLRSQQNYQHISGFLTVRERSATRFLPKYQKAIQTGNLQGGINEFALLSWITDKWVETSITEDSTSSDFFGTFLDRCLRNSPVGSISLGPKSWIIDIGTKEAFLAFAKSTNNQADYPDLKGEKLSEELFSYWSHYLARLTR